jgi:peptidoglycan/LPS O-acetylase OafA/YrhL
MSGAAITDNASEPSQEPVSEETNASVLAGGVRPAAGRNEAIDVVRAFAAAGIVFVHAAEAPIFDKWGNLFRFGVPFFLFASLYFQSNSLRRKPGRTLGQFVAERFHRLYLPFLAWSVICLGARDFERIFLKHLPVVWPQLPMLWTGTEYHLWFLPFLLAWSIVLAIFHKGLLQRDLRWRWPLIGVAVAIGCVLASRPLPYMPPASELAIEQPTYAYIQWCLAAPAAFWAIAFAWFMTLGPRMYGVSPAMGWSGILLVAICSVHQALHGIELAPRALTGLGSMLPALANWKQPVVRSLARLGRMGYGIYLCHVFPVEILHLIFHRCHLQPAAWLDVTNFCVSFLASVLIVYLLGRSPRLAWLNG